MTIVITQICDRCQIIRILSILSPSIERVAELNGWREVQERKHLCPMCISNVLSNVLSKRPIITNSKEIDG